MEKLRNCGVWEKKKKIKLWPLEEERKTKGARTVSLPRECIFNLFIKLRLKCKKKVFSFLLLTRRSILVQGDRKQSVSITIFLYKLFNCPSPIRCYWYYSLLFRKRRRKNLRFFPTVTKGLKLFVLTNAMLFVFLNFLEKHIPAAAYLNPTFPMQLPHSTMTFDYIQQYFHYNDKWTSESFIDLPTNQHLNW